MLTEPKMGLAAAAAGASADRVGLYDTHYTERFMSTPQANPTAMPPSDVHSPAAEPDRTAAADARHGRRQRHPRELDPS
jgi:hypothetical protein